MMQPMQTLARENLDSLLLCTRPWVDGDAAERILALAKNALDWEALLSAAAEHSLTPVLCKNLEANAGDALPSSWRERLNEEFLRNSCRNLALTAELFRVLEALEKHGVRATPYKGPVLAAQGYGDAALRQFSDLDIIVPQLEIAAAHGALLALGFQSVIGRETPDAFRQIPGQYAYRKEPEMMVELHTERTLRYFPRGLNLGELCERREHVTVAGRRVMTFALEDTLLLLSVHGSKHIWERLGWIADIAALTKTPRPLDWALALERARRWGVQRMVLLGAGLAARLFDARLPGEVVDGLKRDAVARQLIDGICQRFFSAGQMQLGVFGRFAFRMRMRGSLPQGLRYAVRLAMMPTELDRGRHARFLEPLYALRRPLRLARTYGWRMRAGS
jgi:hypothetical protein